MANEQHDDGGVGRDQAGFGATIAIRASGDEPFRSFSNSTTGGGAVISSSSPFGGCSRTTPLIWTAAAATGAAPTGSFFHSQTVKQEICATTSEASWATVPSLVNVKIEPKSPSALSLWDDNPDPVQARSIRNIAIMDPTNGAPQHCGAGQIPVGIAVARQRLHHPEGGGTVIKDVQNRAPSFVEMIQGPHMGGHNLFLSATPHTAQFPGDGGIQNPAMRNPSAIWQYPMEPILPMSLPPVGQLVRDPATGQYMFVPSIDPFSQTVIWPSFTNVQSAQPAPIQFLGPSDYLSASTTLHQQHTQTSTRLVALPNNDLKQRYSVTGGDNSTTPLLGVNKGSNSRILQSSHGNTIIKIEDNTNSLKNLSEHLEPAPNFTLGPSLNTTTDLLNANVSNIMGQGFMMPHTPILTPAPSLFDMTDKSFLASVSQQQRQFQMNLNSSLQIDAGLCQMDRGGSVGLPTDLSSVIYSQPRMTATTQNEFPQQLTAATTLPSLTTLDSSALTFGVHSSLFLTPDTVIAARSTGGLLTPPSPMPSKMAPLNPSLMADNSSGHQARPPPLMAASPSSLIAVCPIDLEAGPGEAEVVGSRRRSKSSPVKIAYRSVDATMQTDTPVCSDEDTQDTNCSCNKEYEKECLGECSREEKERSEGMSSETGSDLRPSLMEITVESEKTGEPVDLSGLKLLSNSIEEFEKKIIIKKEMLGNRANIMKDEEFEAVNRIEEEKSVEKDAVLQSGSGNESILPSAPLQFDGLNLLCALAEQRLVEEGNEVKADPPNGVSSSSKEEFPSLEQSLSLEQGRSTKRPESTTNCSSSNVDNLSDLELNIKKRLADLTRQCEEKRRELDKMDQRNPFYRMGTYSQSYTTPSKYAMSDDEETQSSRSATVRTPLTPTLLFGSNNANCSAFVSDVPKISSDTESSKYDEGDAISLERMSKRKGVVPRKWDDCSETETIVAKKPKSLVGYIFSLKNRTEKNIKGSTLIKHGQLQSVQYSNSLSSGSTSSETAKSEPMKVKEEIMDGGGDEISQDADGSENNPFSFITNRFTATTSAELGEIPAVDLFKSKCKNDVMVEERKHHKKNKNKKHRHKFSTAKKKRNDGMSHRCRLTQDHLDDKEIKTRVLTSMGGLFYAGVLSPIQPPDIYSVILDGQRGNRPHIMSREEVQRDAILEIVPNDPSEVPPGTRLCAYWSQQYRCLYPGTAAQPGTPDANSKKQYISVEFDDGDSGRIAINDIRLLFKDYPIVEYDPNPLLSLKRKRLTNATTLMSQEAGGSVFSELNPEDTGDLVVRSNKAADRERRRTKKIKKHKMKRQLYEEQQSPINKQLKESKKKSKCMEEFCTHRKHKKKRKHKKHSTAKEVNAADDNAVSTTMSKQSATVVSSDDVVTDKFAALETEDDTMDSYRDDPDFNGGPVNSQPTNKKVDSHSPEQNKSKIAAFLPARQLWDWAGQSYRRSCVKGRVRKQFYKMIQRGRETIGIGDSAVFLSTGRPDRPYIGRIVSMWKTNSCNMIVRVKWFYHPEETEGCPKLIYPGGLFESCHEDENDVQTISHKCEVLNVYDFKKKLGDDPNIISSIYDNNDTYYQAGFYDPTARSLTMQPNIPTADDGGVGLVDLSSCT